MKYINEILAKGAFTIYPENRTKGYIITLSETNLIEYTTRANYGIIYHIRIDVPLIQEYKISDLSKYQSTLKHTEFRC